MLSWNGSTPTPAAAAEPPGACTPEPRQGADARRPLSRSTVPPRILVPTRPLLHKTRSWVTDALLFAAVGTVVIAFCIFCLIAGEALS